jgi:hypothetical protein
VRVEDRMDPDLSYGNRLNISLTPPRMLWDISKKALKPPKGCAGAGDATSFHKPSVNLTRKPFRHYPNGRVRWNNPIKTTMQMAFRTLCVVFDRPTGSIIALREAEWELNVDSSQSADQYADVPQDDGNVSSNLAEWRVQKTKSQTKKDGTATVEFEKEKD